MRLASHRCDDNNGADVLPSFLQPSYADELQAALLNGKEAEAKLRFELVKSKEAAGGTNVIYQDESTARVVS